jgi:hypothetical protein
MSGHEGRQVLLPRDADRTQAVLIDHGLGRREGRAPFLISLQRIRDFQHSCARLPVPHAADRGESDLGHWLHAQISLARDGRLEPLHSLLLEEILGPGWDDGAAPELRAQQA